MQEQNLETSDETTLTCKVEKHNSTQNRIRFKNNIASIGDEVIPITSEQYHQLIQNKNDAEKYIAKINQLEFEINDADIRTLKKENEDLKKQIKNNNNSITSYKTNSVKNKATIEDLQQTISELKDMNDAIAKEKDKLVAILNDVQERFGYVPEKAQEEISCQD